VASRRVVIVQAASPFAFNRISIWVVSGGIVSVGVAEVWAALADPVAAGRNALVAASGARRPP